MAVVKDPKTSMLAFVEKCRSCGAKVYWSTTDAGRRCPFNVDAESEPTRESHFRTCPQAGQWSKRAAPKHGDDAASF